MRTLFLGGFAVAAAFDGGFISVRDRTGAVSAHFFKVGGARFAEPAASLAAAEFVVKVGAEVGAGSDIVASLAAVGDWERGVHDGVGVALHVLAHHLLGVHVGSDVGSLEIVEVGVVVAGRRVAGALALDGGSGRCESGCGTVDGCGHGIVRVEMHARWAVAGAKAVDTGMGAVALVMWLLRCQRDSVVWHVTVDGLKGLVEDVVDDLEVTLRADVGHWQSLIGLSRRAVDTATHAAPLRSL